MLRSEDELVFALVDIAIGGAQPRATCAAMLEASTLEECDTRAVVLGDACPNLLNAECLAAIVADSLDSGSRIASAAVFGCVDEYAYAEAEVLWVEVEDVESADSDTLGLDDKAHLSRGVEIVALLLDKLREAVLREWCNIATYAPHVAVVFPEVHKLNIGGLQSAQTAYVIRAGENHCALTTR